MKVEKSSASMRDLATLIIHTADPAASRPTAIIYSHSNHCKLTSPALRLVPHRLQMLNNRKIPIQKPIHTILCTALLALIQLPTADGPSYTFLPADIGQGVYGYVTGFSSAEPH